MGWHKRLAIIICTVLFCVTITLRSYGDEPRILIVLGAPGEPEYGTIFQACGKRWREAFGDAKIKFLDGTEVPDRGGDVSSDSESDTRNNEQPSSAESHRQQILDWISQHESNGSGPSEDASVREIVNDEVRWIIMIGHGTSDRSGSKFNLAGPDLSAKELSAAMKSSSHRWVILNCSSSSGPFLAELSGPNRIVVTATKSGAEQNYSRFADYLSRALNDPKSDLDHDSQISVLEAFLASSSGVARFYEDEGRLASEQALLDDNADKRGTPALFFRGLRAVKAPKDGLKLDGELAKRLIITRLTDAANLTVESSTKAQEIESKIALLRQQKKEMDEVEFANQLEVLLLELADILLPK
ncbi:MAG: hypothetical protein MUC43_02770 [Pirellula sp.]|jgi:hypothetical protein|nr:hypothetical protein [Pirellula sp.]